MKNIKISIVAVTFALSLCSNLNASEDHTGHKMQGKHDHKAEKDHSGHNMQDKHDHKMDKDHSHKDDVASVKSMKDGKLTIKVKGMVCAFCAQGIEKNFNALPEVKSTKVDLDKMEVYVELKKDKKLSEEVIKKVVVDAGFGFQGVN